MLTCSVRRESAVGTRRPASRNHVADRKAIALLLVCGVMVWREEGDLPQPACAFSSCQPLASRVLNPAGRWLVPARSGSDE